MIKITDNKETIVLTAKDIEVHDNYFLIKPFYDYWVIKLFIIIEKGVLKEIIKAYSLNDDVLDCFKSKTKLPNTLIFSSGDFKRFKRLFANMRNKKNYRKDAIVKAYSTLLSYEFYQTVVLEDNPSITIQDLFKELHNNYNYEIYKEEILKLSEINIQNNYK